jgi:SAM-dependent methyltransferase
MQSQAEWELRNAALSRSVAALIIEHRQSGAARALDIGAQSGALTDRYARLTGMEFAGVDPIFSEEHASPDGARLLPGTADSLPFPDAAFDVVVFANVFEHVVPDRRVASLQEIRRVLSRGGVVVGQIPNPYFVIENHSRLPLMGYLPIRLQKQYWRVSRVPWDHDFFVVTPRHLRRDAQAAGFTVTLVRRYNYPLEVIPERVRPIARAIDRPTRRFMPWAWQFVLTREPS